MKEKNENKTGGTCNSDNTQWVEKYDELKLLHLRPEKPA